jgi:acetyl esterase
MPREKYERTDLLPEVEQLLAMTRAQKSAGEWPAPLETLRAAHPAMAAYFGVGAPPIALEREITVPGAAGPLRAMMYAPVAEPQGMPVVLHFHGGGFCWMQPESYAKPNKEVAIAANAIVVSFDYRLAPEHPYPEPLDDCVAAYRWLRGHASEIGGDPSRIALAGESAGGGLAASTVLRLIAEGDELPRALAVSCAWLDLRDSSKSFRAFGPDDPFIDDATMAGWRACYAPGEKQWTDPLVSPVFGDVSKFPPTCVVVGGIDPLYDDGVTLADNLRDAGRSVELYDYEGMPHIFWCYPQLFGKNDAMGRVGGFLRTHLDP